MYLKMFEEFNKIKSSKSELKKFGNTMGIVWLLICLILIFYTKDSYIYFLVIGAVFIFLGNLIPSILKPFQKLWMGLALILGWISTRIILGVLFYFIITPIRFIARLFGKIFLDLEFRKPLNTYWNYRTPQQLSPEDYERQF